jgi:hypothetical protein
MLKVFLAKWFYEKQSSHFYLNFYNVRVRLESNDLKLRKIIAIKSEK